MVNKDSPIKFTLYCLYTYTFFFTVFMLINIKLKIRQIIELMICDQRSSPKYFRKVPIETLHAKIN